MKLTLAGVVFVGASVALLVLSVGQNSDAQDALGDRADHLFAEWSRRDSPGCSVGVSRSGVPIFERGYGMANIERGVPITPTSVFHVASISKQFTAMSILLLAQRGKLSLDDDGLEARP